MRICLFGLVCMLASFDALAAQPLFKEAPATTSQALAAIQKIVSAPDTRDAAIETVHFNAALFTARPGDTFTLALGSGFRVITRKVIAHAGGITTWIGALADQRLPYNLTLTRAADDTIVGEIYLPGKIYQVLPGDAAVTLIVSYGWRPDKLQHDWVEPPAKPRRNALDTAPLRTTESAGASTAGPAAIDVLIAYSRGVVRTHPGAALAAYLHSLVDAANTAYANSDIDLTLRLAGSVEVDFGDGMSATDLLDCISGQGQSPVGCDTDAVRVVHALRAVHTADLVMMIADTSGAAVNDTAGIAYEGGSGGCGAAPYCFSADYGYAAMLTGFRDPSTFTHEIGHNLGAGHDIDAPDNGGAFSYSHGHLFGNDDGTVMAYADHQNLIFSSPDYTCGSAPCGNKQSEDNAETLRQTAGVVAAYSNRTPTPTQLGRAAPGQPVSISLYGGSDQGVIGPTATIRLLKNGTPVQVLAYATALHDSNDIKLTLPPNLSPAADYALEFDPTYRTGITFTLPLDIAYQAPAMTRFTTTHVGQTQASFSAGIDLHGLDTTLQLTTADGTAGLGPVTIAAQARDTPQPRSLKLTLSGLDCGTSYSVTLDADNANGTVSSSTQFTTLPCGGSSPAISSITTSGGDAESETLVLNGTPNGPQASFAIAYGPDAWFDGTQTDYQTPIDAGPLSFTLDNLQCGTTYHYRAIAYSATGDARSAPATFTTAACRHGTFLIEGDATVNAAAGTATYHVQRTNGSDGKATVNFAAVAGTAKANQEYLETAGTLVFADGQTERTISVPILLSPTDSGDYTFTLQLSDPNGADLAAQNSVQTVIRYTNALTPLRAYDGSITTMAGRAIKGVLGATSNDGTVIYSIVDAPGHGTVTLTDRSTGAFVYTPDSAFAGKDTFTFKASNDGSDSNVATETITVQSVRDEDVVSRRDKTGGGGALGLVTLFALGFGICFRRVRIREVRKLRR
ncbi:MAG TPA: M12 family metallo-peptidase [Gammaproteobacteria bacterium]|nr:M12 family metallo-peptidase [Gammaproteobacteria bacterium]